MIEVYEKLESGIQEYVDEASRYLENIYKDSSCVEIHLVSLENDCNLYVKRSIVISLCRVLPIYVDEFSSEYIFQLLNRVFGLISSFDDVMCCFFLCDLIIIIMESSHGESINKIVENFIGNQDLKIRLYLLRNGSFSNAIIIRNAFEESLDSLLAENDWERSLSFGIIEKFATDFSDNPDFIDSIEQAFSFYVNDCDIINDLGCCVRVICSLLTNTSYSESMVNIIEEAIHLISNESISIDKRIIIHNILESSLNVISSLDSSSLSEIIESSLRLSVCSLESNEIELQYMFIVSFLSELSFAFNENCETFFNILLQFIEYMIRVAKSSYQIVALLALGSIIEGCSEIACESIEVIFGIVFSNFVIEDENIIDQQCSVLNEIIEFCGDSISGYLDFLCEFLLNNSNCNCALKTLDELLYRIEETPSSISEIFEYLLRDIGDGHEKEELVFRCISSILMHTNDGDENTFEIVFPVLKEYLEGHPSSFAVMFECFARLGTLCPKSFKIFLPFLIDTAVDSFNMENYHINDMIIRGFEILLCVFPCSLGDHINDIVPPLFAFIQDKSNDDYLDVVQKSSLRLLFKFIGLCPIEMSDYRDQSLTFLLKKNDDIDSFLLSVWDGLAFSIDSTETDIFDWSILLETYLRFLDDCISKPAACGVLMICGQILASSNLINESSLSLSYQFSIRLMKNEVLSVQRSSTSFLYDILMLKPIYYFINQLLVRDTLDQEKQNEFLSSLDRNLGSDLIIIRLLSLSLLSRFLNIYSQYVQQYDLIIRDSFKLSNSLSDCEQKRVFFGFITQVFSIQSINTDELNTQIASLLCEVISSYGEPGIKHSSLLNSAIGAFSMMYTRYPLGFSENIFNTVLSLLPVQPNSDEIIYTSHFLFQMSESRFIKDSTLKCAAVTLFQSSSWCLKSINQNAMEWYQNILRSMDLEEISQLSNYNEAKIMQIQHNMCQ